MDWPQVLITAAVGLVASLVTALVTHSLTRSQERRRHERDVASKLAELKSTERSQTMVMAVQYGHSCFIVERPDQEERDRVFLPMGSRITMGRDPSNHITLDHAGVSRMHAAFRAQGDAAFLEPLAPTMGIKVNDRLVDQPRKLETGDVITVPGSPFRITFVRLVA
ncbi:MAG: FHA domain-containing protein [Candidatus Woesearchaeota archaeon]